MFNVKTSCKCSDFGLPRTDGEFENKNKKEPGRKPCDSESLPGHGASVDCIEENFAKKHNLVILPDRTNMIELVSVEGKTM